MARPDLGFHRGDLAPATGNSRGLLPALLDDLIEAAPVSVESRLLARETLPPRNRHIDVLGIDVYAVADPARALGRNERAAASQEWVVDHLATLGMVHDGAAHQFNGLLGPVASN